MKNSGVSCVDELMEAYLKKKKSFDNSMRLSIIGTAGPRKFNGGLSTTAVNETMTKELFDAMVLRVRTFIGFKDLSTIDLISGGAAWAGNKTPCFMFFMCSKINLALYFIILDHVAVQLFLDGGFRSLTLHIPVQWDATSCQYFDNGMGNNWKTNPGFLANLCHKGFSKAIGHDTLKDIRLAIDLGAHVHTYKGFHARNLEIAKGCDVLLAFSWAPGDAPVNGGTFDTWKKCNSKKHHYSLTSVLSCEVTNKVSKKQKIKHE